jgi:cyclic pyranopterin phosphate synthase
MGRKLTYLRVVATTRCNHHCDYCHMEGDPHTPGTPSELPTETLLTTLRTAVQAGVKKFKFLGGEPLLRRDLPEVVAALRAMAPDLDISAITAGVVPVTRLHALYDAGLTRINVSIHGWSPEALAKRITVRDAWSTRQTFLHAALDEAIRRGVPLKLNYVWSGTHDRDDLAALLSWCAGRPVTVGLLDDLGRDLSYRDLERELVALRGAPSRRSIVDDPHSLATQLLVWDDGLRVELKHQALGALAPFEACHGCPQRPRCREGILALRLTHRGMLQPCLDRPDLGCPMADYAARNGPALAAVFWNRFVEAL